MRAPHSSRLTVVLATFASIACQGSAGSSAPATEASAPSSTASVAPEAPSAEIAPPAIEAAVIDAGGPPAASASASPPRCADGCKSPAAAYAALLPGGHDCKHASRTFPDVLPVGSFAYDRGCIARGVIVGCCLRSGAEVAAERFQGWPQIAPETRKAQAVAWVREITFAFTEVLESRPEDFVRYNRPFSPPAAAVLAEGGVVVTAWLREPSGMHPQTVYTMQQVRFGPTGAVERIAEIAEWMTR